MAAANLDLHIDQGATFSQKFKIQTNADTPVAVNLTGRTFKGQIRKYAGDSTVLAEFDFELLNQTTNTGEFLVKMSAEDTAAIAVKATKEAARVDAEFAYDIQQIYASGDIERILYGLVKLSPAVTVDE